VVLSSTGTRQKPALDETSFQQLLAAAYVVQQHNEGSRRDKGDSRANDPLETSTVLNEIAQIQSLIRAGNLNVASACALIADRLETMTSASGVSISLIMDGYLDCVAETGLPAKVSGSCVTSHSLVATERLKSRQTFQSVNAQADWSLEAGLCQKLGVKSLVAAPILRFEELAGLIEVRWDQLRASIDSDLRACRLMAGLASGMLERSVRLQQRQPPAAEVVVESPTIPLVEPAITLSPSAPSIDEAPNPGTTVGSAETGVEGSPQPRDEEIVREPASCRVCGKPFGADEAFCGFCSMPRQGDAPSPDLQGKWASLWYMQRAKDALQEVAEPAPEPAAAPLTAAPVYSPPIAEPETRAQTNQEPEFELEESFAADHHSDAVHESLLEPQPGEKVRAWLQHLPALKRRWRDALLAAVALVLAYGLMSAWPTSGAGMTWFQSLAIRLGLVHGSARPTVYVGRPDARVWVDVHTSLYYCEGSDLYGKTPGGEFTTQHDAQSDNLEPASRTACP
jgi:hypothetical protein